MLQFPCSLKPLGGAQTIDLVTVFDAILTRRQMREKLQCLYENLMSNNFRRTSTGLISWASVCDNIKGRSEKASLHLFED